MLSPKLDTCSDTYMSPKPEVAKMRDNHQPFLFLQ